MISTKILENGLAENTYIDEANIGITEICYDGSPLTGNETTLIMEPVKKLTVKIKTTSLNEMLNIKSIKLSLGTTSLLKNTFKLSLETGHTSDTSNYVKDFVKSDISGRHEVDITEYVLDEQSDTFYFGITPSKLGGILVGPNNKPYLTVEYVDKHYLSKNRNMIDGSIGLSTTYKANIKYGELLVNKQLYSFNGCLNPLNLSLVYNSLGNDNFNEEGLPLGWKFNYFHRLIINDDFIVYIDTEGMKHHFNKLGDSLYCDTSGTGLTLGKGYNYGEYSYSIRDCKNTNIIFNMDGYVTKIATSVGIRDIITTLSYDSNKKLEKIKDAMGNEVMITYTDSQIILTKAGYPTITLNVSNNKLVSINDSAARTTLFTYEGDLLTKVETDNGETTSFTFDVHKRVLTIQDGVIKDGVTSILEKRKLDYLSAKTIITNYHNKSFEYVFDDEGEIINETEIEVLSQVRTKAKKKDGLTVTYLHQKFNSNHILRRTVLELKCDQFDSNGNRIMTKSSGNIVEEAKALVYEADTEYLATFRYKFASLPTELTTDCGAYLLVYQEVKDSENNVTNENIGGIKLDLKSITSTTSSFIFKTHENSTVMPKFQLVLDGLIAEVELETAGIDKYYKNNRYVCFNYPSDSTETYECESINWYPKNSIKTTIRYGNSDGTQTTTKTLQLYEEDIKENIKNAVLSVLFYSSFRLWYNNKHSFIPSVENVEIKFGDNWYPLESLKMCIVNELHDKTMFSYYDYSNAGSVTNILRTEYQKILFSGNVYENSKIISRDYKPLKVSNFDKTYTNYSYDEYGNLIGECFGTTQTSEVLNKIYSYDEFKYLLTEQVYDGGQPKTTSYEYNNLGLVSKVTYPNGLVEEYVYDPATLDLTKIKFTDGVQSIESNVSYQKDLVTKMSHKNNIGYDFTYDKYNMMSTVNSNFNSTVNNMFMHSADITTTFDEYKKTWASGYQEKFVLDSYGNTVLEAHLDDEMGEFVTDKKYYVSDLHYAYIPVDDEPTSSYIRKSKDSQLKLEFDEVTGDYFIYMYTPKGKLRRIEYRSSSENRASEFEYDLYDRMIGRTFVTNGLNIDSTFTYRNGGLEPTEDIEEVVVDVTNTINDVEYENTFEYKNFLDSLNRLSYTTRMLNEHGVKTTYSYNKSAENITTSVPSNESYYFVNTDENVLSTFGSVSYLYDEMNNIVSKSDTVTNESVRYQYDLFGRLIREDNKKLDKSIKNTYDDKGNIIKKEIGAYTLDEDLTIIETINYEYSTEYPDRLISYNGQAVTYDLNGNVTAIGNNTYTWIKGRELKESTVNRVTNEYTHDGDGRLTRKILYNGVEHKYVYEKDRLITEIYKGPLTNWDFEIDYVYAGNEVLGFICNGEGYIFIKNAQHDITGVCQLKLGI